MRSSGRLAVAAIPAALTVLAAAACSGGSGPARTSAGHTASAPDAAAAELTISPANGARNAAPDQGITVTASHGTLGRVTVTANGQPVAGALTSGGTGSPPPPATPRAQRSPPPARSAR